MAKCPNCWGPVGEDGYSRTRVHGLAEKDAEIAALKAENARLTKERDEARQWVRDLHSGMYINCVYCGHRYGPKESTPESMADVLKAHIERCPQHPMSALKADRDSLAATVGEIRSAILKAEPCGVDKDGECERRLNSLALMARSITPPAALSVLEKRIRAEVWREARRRNEVHRTDCGVYSSPAREPGAGEDAAEAGVENV